jgi:predicted neuraminidase
MSKSLLLLLATMSFAAPRAQFIYEQAPFPSCHASTIVETTPGEFLAAWFGGAAEGRPDVAIWGARLKEGKWSEPFEMVREPNIATYNPVLFFARDGTLWLYYRFGPSPQTWTSGRVSSRDRGQTWSQPEHLPAGVHGPIKNKPLVLKDGAIVSGTSIESYRSWTSYVELSRDNGRTWTRSLPITARPLAPFPADSTRPSGTIQPAIVPLGGKRLRMFVRATPDIGRICYADSSDNGVTWTAARPTSLPNPNSGIDAVGLRDGRIVLVYNHVEKGRSPLNLAVSVDGQEWRMFATLESEPGEFSYPAIIQSAAGDLHVTYTWNRRKIRHATVGLSEIR